MLIAIFSKSIFPLLYPFIRRSFKEYLPIFWDALKTILHGVEMLEGLYTTFHTIYTCISLLLIIFFSHSVRSSNLTMYPQSTSFSNDVFIFIRSVSLFSLSFFICLLIFWSARLLFPLSLWVTCSSSILKGSLCWNCPLSSCFMQAFIIALSLCSSGTESSIGSIFLHTSHSKHLKHLLFTCTLL